jgi:tetratricopeptide (TPR) repeat protein
VPAKLLAALALGAIAVSSTTAQTLDLVGEVNPPLARGRATLSAVQSPLYRESPVRESRFVFRSLAPGGYTLVVMDPSWGLTRQTVQVTGSFADEKGRVQVEVDLDRSAVTRARRVEDQGTVSVADLKVTPKARAAVRKAHARFGKGDQQGAIALLHKAVEISPSFTQAWNELGTVAYKAGRYSDAEGYFRTALDHDPLAFEPLVNLGGALLSQNRFDDALNFNLAAQGMRPDSALANAQLGINFFHKSQFHKAREFLLRAKQADPSHFSYPQLFLAEIYGKQGKLAEARGELDEMLRLHPDAPVTDLARNALRRLDEAHGQAGSPP